MNHSDKAVFTLVSAITSSQLLLDLLQQPISVIAGDERNVFVGA